MNHPGQGLQTYEYTVPKFFDGLKVCDGIKIGAGTTSGNGTTDRAAAGVPVDGNTWN